MGYHWTSYLYYSILLKPFHFFPTNYVYVRASLYFSNLPSRYYHSSSPPILLLFSFYKYPLYYSQISPQNLTHFLLPRYFTVLLQLMISLATQFFLSHSTSTSLYVQAEITKQKLKEKKRILTHATHIYSLSFTIDIVSSVFLEMARSTRRPLYILLIILQNVVMFLVHRRCSFNLHRICYSKTLSTLIRLYQSTSSTYTKNDLFSTTDFFQRSIVAQPASTMRQNRMK